MQKASSHRVHSMALYRSFPSYRSQGTDTTHQTSWPQNGPGSYTLYAIGCRYYFTPLAGVLFTFPSRYWFTIGCQGVFSLIRWSGQIHAEFHVHRVTWDALRGCSSFRAPGSHGLRPIFPNRYASFPPPTSRSRYPGKTSPPGLGCSAFARHY